MRLRTTTISILAVGLLAGSAVGVAAQDDEAASAAEPVQFVQFGRDGYDVERLEELLASEGEDIDYDEVEPGFWVGSSFAGFGDIPGGTVEWFGGNADDQTASATLIFDPDPPGGDTFTLYWQAEVVDSLDSEQSMTEPGEMPELWVGEGDWNVLPGSGTGALEGLTGEGRVYIVSHGTESDSTEVVTYTGSLEMPE